MNSAMGQLRLERDGAIAMIAIVGEVDLSNVPDLRRRVFGFIENDDAAVVVDLADLAFIDSAGIGMVFELSDLLEERRQRLLIVVPPGTQPRRTVEIVGLGSALGLFDDIEEALGAARVQTRPPEV